MTQDTRLVECHLRAVDIEESTSIAFDAGFNDLSTFNRRFRRLMGASPRVYRAQGRMAN